jgi:hypothetical protein
MIVAGISLCRGGHRLLPVPGSGVGLAMGLLPIVLLFYLNSRDVKEAFGEVASSDSSI